MSRQRTTSEGQGEMTKYPIKRLEISIKNFIKVLSIALDRLKKHSVNIKRLTAVEDWQELHKEQVNATRTVQQITANIKEIEKVRCQVKDEDLPTFDDRVSGVKTEAVTALDHFLVLLGGEAANELGVSQMSSDRRESQCGKGDLSPMEENENHHISSIKPRIAAASSSSSSSPFQDATAVSRPKSDTEASKDSDTATPYASHHSPMSKAPNHMTHSDDTYDIMDNAMSEEQSVQTPLLVTTDLHVIPQNSEASASWEELKENIEDLNELVHVFAEKVEEQGETLNCIEDNIDSAHANVEEGTSQLGLASKYKAAMFPAVGAVLGGVLGGPIGFVAGMKIGGLAAVTGGAVGYAGGRYIKKRQDKIVEMEMTKMSSSTPVPDLGHEKEDGGRADENTKTAGEDVGVKSFVNSVKGWFDGGQDKESKEGGKE